MFKKLFIPIALLLAVLGTSYAITVPAWWMIGQSATDQGTASFTVPITTSQTLGVTGKTTTGTLESGEATFTGDVGLGAGNEISSSKYTLLHSQGQNVAGIAVNTRAASNGAWSKDSTASASAVMYLGSNGNPVIYRSDAGNASALQNGPYAVWHGGMTGFSGVNPRINPGTSDGSDNGSSHLCGGGGPFNNYGAFVGAYGNEHSSLAGVLQLSAGAVASGVIGFYTNNSYRGSILNSGAWVITSLSGTGNRAVYSDPTGTLTNSTSDGTLKENVMPIVGALDKVRALRGITYQWIDKANMGDQREMGMIAQEVQPVVPEVIGTNSNGKLSLDYPKLTALLIEAMKQQQAQIESIESRIKSLEEK